MGFDFIEMDSFIYAMIVAEGPTIRLNIVINVSKVIVLSVGAKVTIFGIMKMERSLTIVRQNVDKDS
jgi:hypothetical protein